MYNPVADFITTLFTLMQFIISYCLASRPPSPNAKLSRPRIAIIGAGLTGVSSAAHCVGHGFDVTIFEEGDRGALGGIWSVSPSNFFSSIERSVSYRRP